MSDQRPSSPFPDPLSYTAEDEPYRDNPSMNSPQDPKDRIPVLSYTEPPNPPRLTFRSSVGLIPTPGTVSQQHPTYVRRRSRLIDSHALSLIFFLCRSRLCYDFGQ
jgi:hypothetical protein